MTRKKAERQDQDRGFIFLGDRAFTLEDLGPAADMRLDDAMQYLTDNGFFGEVPPGTEWYKLKPKMDFVGLRPDCELEAAAWEELKDAEKTAHSSKSEEDKTVVSEKFQKLRMVKKLTRP